MMQPSRQEYEQRKELERLEKQDHFRIAAKMLEFVGVVLGVVCIFVLLALLFSLITWLDQDIASTFSILRTRFQ
ncbi:MAG: hypothetical protein IJP78_06895 [Clostridia bacterium]|nr:hypothetical protein [Clostridia bacterium]